MAQNFATADIANANIDGLPTAHERMLLDLALIAKGVCSGVFVSGREIEEILAHSVKAETEDGRPVRIEVDRAAGLVKASTDDGVTRAVRHYGDQGAVVLPVGSAKAFFTPALVTSNLPPADEAAWPLGDAGAAVAPGEAWDKALLDEAVETAFSKTPDTFTAAFLIIHNGRIIAERYGAGAHKDMQLPSWSMGKTLTAAMVGRLMQDGAFGLHDPAPLAEWRGADDPRGDITIAHLLRMSSGLDFSAAWAADYAPDKGYPDHSYMYGGAIDMFQLALSRPAAHPPDTLGAYKNGDTLALGAVVKRTVEARGETYFQWPQTALFDKIGVRRLVLEPDPYGNLATSGFNYGAARDWARLGLLFLNDGVTGGERLFPEGFVDFIRSPAPAWSGRYWTEPGPAGWTDSVYGGQVWLNRYPDEDRWPLPVDAYFMLGIGGQYTFVVPSMNMVVVRMGHVRGVLEQNAGRQPLSDALALVMKAYRAHA
ncbi:MAG: serine hydrolase [Pseudomonadota bacterium]